MISTIENLNNLNQLQSLQATCNASMQRVFNYIQGKTLDTSSLTFSNQIPINAVVHGWYKDSNSNPVYIDNRTSPEYIIGIGINGFENNQSCTKNPVEDCLCIMTLALDMNPATATVTNGVVTAITITNGGSGYTEVPDINIYGEGIGAIATATISGGAVTSITVTNGGTGYVQATTNVVVYPPFSLTVPDAVVDEAMSSLPTKSNILLYAGIAAVGIGILYLATRK